MTVIGCAMALGQATARESRDEKTFREWDKNKDGKIAKAELPQQNQHDFNLVDVDKDGFISLKEHVAFLTRPRNQNNRNWSGFKITKDIAYAGTDHERQTLDLALPLKRRNDKPLPVIAYIHGGAWRAGSKNGGLNRLHDILRTGEYAGVTIGYRLSQQVKWPAQIHDCKAAIRWIKANAKKYGLNGDRIAVHGTSAGGHLVAMLGTSAGVEAMDGAIGPHTDQSTSVQCVIDYYGPTNFLRMNDFESRIDHDAADSPESQLIGEAIQENKKQTLTADPISYVDKGDASFLIMHGTKDMLVPYNQSVLLNNALKKSRVQSALLTVEGGGHSGGNGVLPVRFREFIEINLLGKKGIIADETIPVAKVKER